MKKKDDKFQNNIFLNSLRDSGDETNSPSPKLKVLSINKVKKENEQILLIFSVYGWNISFQL